MTRPPDSGPPDSGPLIFLIAGEPSGDALGAGLMTALRAKTAGAVRFAGIGGERMAAAGLDSLFPITELSLLGIAEVVPRIPNLWRRMRQTAAAIRTCRPDAVVSIDVPGFCFGVWRRVRPAKVLLIHYVAPTVWAWRPWRVGKFARTLDHMMTLLPFEPPYFQRAGLAASFVGHPAVAHRVDPRAVAEFRRRHHVDGAAPLVCFGLGSRQGEVARLRGPYAEAVRLLAARFPGLRAVLPTVPPVAEAVRAAAADWPIKALVVVDESERRVGMAAADAALVASGTIALELSLAGVPSVVAYRVNPITWLIAKLMVRVDYASLTNLLLDRPVLPELLQGDCRGDRLAAAVERLLTDESARHGQIAAGREVAVMLGEGATPPSERAAEVVLRIIAERQAGLKEGAPI